MRSKWLIVLIVVAVLILSLGGYLIYRILLTPTPCGNCSSPSPSKSETPTNLLPEGQAKIIFLHHSTGQVIWDGGVKEWFDNYNIEKGTNFQVEERVFPKESPYGWNNYPFDYYNIWVKNGGGTEYKTEPTLNALTKDYNVIVFKHCFLVSHIEVDSGSPNVDSDTKSIENYKLQYNALQKEMRKYKDTKFIVWTGAVETSEVLLDGPANRTKIFFDWVKNEWDEKGDNIFIFDFYNLETEGGLYLKNEYAASLTDSHPNEVFAKKVAPIFGQRVVDVINGKSDE
ncbi:MAG: hypothetical protein NT039_02060 [Candidatus Berkelbacteria bacterium]|nr:hypothetical protein [Candidatus Berkelbacteria bacterium]